MNDLKFAIRQLAKTPGFTVIAVLTLALGVGATTAIFSVVNAVLLRPLPYAEPDRLLRIYTEFPGFPNGGLRRFAASPPEYLDLRRETKSWETLDAWTSFGVNVAGDDQPARARGAEVTGGLLRSLGVNPILGRLITPEDDAPGGPQVIDLSYGLWQRSFGGDPGIVGRGILLNGTKCTVVGVMPKGFQFPPGEVDAPELWAPIQIDPGRSGRALFALSQPAGPPTQGRYRGPGASGNPLRDQTSGRDRLGPPARSQRPSGGELWVAR